MSRYAWTLLFAITGACLNPGSRSGVTAADDGAVQTVLSELAQKAASASPTTPIRGRDGWLFLTSDVRSLTSGRFWDESTGVLPAMLDFKAQLDRAGIELLYVPVPAKAAVYPGALADAARNLPQGTRIDITHQEFHTLLQGRGFQLIDLAPVFLKHRDDPAGPLYCLQDSHWSGRACVLAAQMIAGEIAKRPWFKDIPRKTFAFEERDQEIAGDLWKMLAEPRPQKERLQLRFVGEKNGSTLVPVPASRQSPVLLLGDSHNLVFQAGTDMHATGAGLADQLACELGFAVDLVAVRGSGATPSRVNLMRRGDNLAGKKLVVWCLSVREYNNATDWKKIPVIR